MGVAECDIANYRVSAISEIRYLRSDIRSRAGWGLRSPIRLRYAPARAREPRKYLFTRNSPAPANAWRDSEESRRIIKLVAYLGTDFVCISEW